MIYDIGKYTMRLRKLGADPISAAVSGGLDLIGNGLGLIGTEDEIDTNVQENEKNRKFNAEEAEKQRAWSHDEWDYQFGKQTAEWYNQQDYSNAEAFDYWMKQQDYNSPVAQVKRMQSAGLNPAHVVGDTTFGSTGLSAAPTSVPNPSVPSGHAASVGLSNPASPGAKAQAFANMAKGISDVLNSVYGARRSAAETKKTEQTLDPIIRGLLLDNSNKQLVNTWQELDNMEKEKGMPDRLKNLSNQGKLLIAQAMASTSSSELMNVQTELDGLRKSLVSKEIDVKGKELLIITAEADNIQTAIDLKNELLRQQTKTEKSKQAENFASSFKLRAEGTTENQLRPLREKSLELSNDIARANRRGLNLDNWLKDATLRSKAKIVIEEAKRAGLITQGEVYKLGKQIDDYNHRDIDRFFNWLGQGAGAFRDFGVGSSSIGTGVTKSTPVDSPWTIYGGSTPTSGSGSFIPVD